MTTHKLHRLLLQQLQNAIEPLGVTYCGDWETVNTDRATLVAAVTLSSGQNPRHNHCADAEIRFELVVPAADWTDTEAASLWETVAHRIEQRLVPAESDEKDCRIYSARWTSTAPAANDGVKYVFAVNYEAFVQL